MGNEWEQNQQTTTLASTTNAYDQSYQQQWYAYYQQQQQQQQQQHQVTQETQNPVAKPPLPQAPAMPPPPPPPVWNGTAYVQQTVAPETNQTTDVTTSNHGTTATTTGYYGNEHYAYGSTGYHQSYAAAYGYPQQGNESYPGPYASAAPSYQPPSTTTTTTTTTSYQSPGTYYGNNGVYQQPGAYQTYGGTTASSYAAYGNYPGYGYPNADAGSGYYQQQQSVVASEPTVPPGMETTTVPAPVSTYASVVAHGSGYPAAKQPPPPGTQSAWPAPTTQVQAASNGWNQGQMNQPSPAVAAAFNNNAAVKIAMNPRIPQTLAYQRPAYVSVASKTKPDTSDIKPGTFPPSLRAYVERALARCKDEAQKTICQGIMKEVITKASSDGTLFTKNWDVEPLFPLPSEEKDQTSNVERNRKTKSRWEPVENSAVAQTTAPLQTAFNAFSLQQKQATPVVPVNWLKRDAPWIKPKTIQPPSFQPVPLPQQQAAHQQLQQQQQQQQTPQQQQQQPQFKFQQELQSKKKQKQEGFKFGRKNAKRLKTENAKLEREGSTESEEDADYGGVTLGSLGTSSNPEESKKRQTRFKRFESSKDSNVGGPKKFIKGKTGPGPSASTRRATAMLLAMNNGESLGQPVEDIDWDSLTIKGTSQEIEKRYLRLTSAPDPATVRPEEVLVKALEMVTSTSKNYYYKCEQLKSIRQDLTVQRIRNSFTAQVYETHARTALEAGDLAEYNQCQTQLKGLYSEGIRGCCNEFAAYSLLYIIFQNGSNRDLLSSMARLSAEAKKDESVKHALAVRAAVSSGNYISFFRLYKTAPNLSSFLMDLHVEKMRFEALNCMSRSYRPTLALDMVARSLGFVSESSNEIEALDECEEWVKSHGGHIVIDGNTQERHFDTKTSAATLFMPEPQDAVSHGDTNLAVNDFLARSVVPG